MESMRTAATGMAAQQTTMNVISNNLANVNTAGFKRGRVEFQDLVYRQRRVAGESTAEGVASPVGFEMGLGTRAAATHKIFLAGELQHTENPMDVAIDGAGFFEVRLPDGRAAYTRDGSFKVDPQGRLVTSEGHPLSPDITVPANVSNVTIGQDGTVSATVKNSGTRSLGQIQLVSFINPAGLESTGHNLLVVTEASGHAAPGTPGSEGLGTLSQGYLEASNVSVVEEMVKMIMAQRAYEVNGKAIQMSDEMLAMIAQMHR